MLQNKANFCYFIAKQNDPNSRNDNSTNFNVFEVF